MRICCIDSCRSRCTDVGRSLFEIHDDRKEWKTIIKQHQLLSEKHRNYICDLHFEPQFIRKTDKKCFIVKRAVPNVRIQTRNQNQNNGDYRDYISGISIEANIPTNDLEAQHFHELHSDIDCSNQSGSSIAANTESNTSDVARLIKTVEKLKNKLKEKDEIIKAIQEMHKNELKIRNTFPHLTIEQAEVIECLLYGGENSIYSENVREFCLKQHYHSNTAYESLRLFFNKNLPSKRTLQYWFTSIDGSPGINRSSLDILREKSISYQAEKSHPLHVALCSDEMAIRKDICWDNEKRTFVGFVTIRNSLQNAKRDVPQVEVAKNALVFLVAGPDFKIPIAYHLVNGIAAVDRANFSREVIRRVEETGIKIICFTTDGLFANVTVAEILGAKFKEKKPYFYSPTYPDQHIYIIFDPPHMLKLIRKHFSNGKLYSEKGLLDWNLLRVLVEKQRGENFNLCNKLTEHHIDWHHKEMNVKLAAQTISRSVADALEQLNIDGYKEFENSQATVEFLRNGNDIFDVLNFAEKDDSNNFMKQPLNQEGENTILPFAERMQMYLEKITVEVKTKKGFIKKPIFESREKMGFFGFHVDLISLKGMFNDFLKNGPLQVIHTKMFSQDHIETLFSLIRSRQGRNTNPNAIEFASAFKKLLLCHPLTTSLGQNVISNATGLLTVSSRIKMSLPLTNSNDYIVVNNEELMSNSADPTDAYDMHLNAYIAQCVEEKMLQTYKLSKKKSCSECVNVLLDSNDSINDELLAMKNGRQPCKSTSKIIIFSEAVIEMIYSNEMRINFDEVHQTICNNLNINDFYTTSNFEHHQQSHKEQFVKEVVKTYLTLKSRNIGKRIGDEERGAFIRSRLEAQKHFAGQ